MHSHVDERSLFEGRNYCLYDSMKLSCVHAVFVSKLQLRERQNNSSCETIDIFSMNICFSFINLYYSSRFYYFSEERILYPRQLNNHHNLMECCILIY